jgi:hypothetical protein
VLVLDMIKILPPLRIYKYDTWRKIPMKCYIDNSVRLRSCIQNVKTPHKLSYYLLVFQDLFLYFLSLSLQS